MVSKAKLDESDMVMKPGKIYKSGNRYYEVDVWGVSHPIKKSVIEGRSRK